MVPGILVVEDEPILALELRNDLEDLGYQVTDVVSDADMVLPSYLKKRPDVVLMDIRLYGFRDGIDAATQIRGFYKTPLIYLSSLPESEVASRLPKTEPYTYLQKPYDLTQLRGALDQVGFPGP